jgi:hypothetical protein
LTLTANVAVKVYMTCTATASLAGLDADERHFDLNWLVR